MKSISVKLGALAVGSSLLAVVLVTSAAPRASAQGGEKPKYVGAAACKKCHLKEFKSWNETKMAKAFNVLKAGEDKEAKAKAKLDAAKDYTKEEGCVKCHVTGYGEPGGYPKVGDADQALAADRAGVQCEVCHGPGSAYAVYMKEHEKDYKQDEAKKIGLIVPDGSECASCHKGGEGGSPFMAADAKFDGAAKIKAEKDSGIHGHFKKK